MLRQAFFMSECGAAFTKLRCVMFRVGEIDVSGLKQFDNLLGSLGQLGAGWPKGDHPRIEPHR
jgi:hypothetical protein